MWILASYVYSPWSSWNPSHVGSVRAERSLGLRDSLGLTIWMVRAPSLPLLLCWLLSSFFVLIAFSVWSKNNCTALSPFSGQPYQSPWVGLGASGPGPHRPPCNWAGLTYSCTGLAERISICCLNQYACMIRLFASNITFSLSSFLLWPF